MGIWLQTYFSKLGVSQYQISTAIRSSISIESVENKINYQLRMWYKMYFLSMVWWHFFFFNKSEYFIFNHHIYICIYSLLWTINKVFWLIENVWSQAYNHFFDLPMQSLLFWGCMISIGQRLNALGHPGGYSVCQRDGLLPKISIQWLNGASDNKGIC